MSNGNLINNSNNQNVNENLNQQQIEISKEFKKLQHFKDKKVKGYKVGCFIMGLIGIGAIVPTGIFVNKYLNSDYQTLKSYVKARDNFNNNFEIFANKVYATLSSNGGNISSSLIDGWKKSYQFENTELDSLTSLWNHSSYTGSVLNSSFIKGINDTNARDYILVYNASKALAFTKYFSPDYIYYQTFQNEINACSNSLNSVNSKINSLSVIRYKDIEQQQYLLKMGISAGVAAYFLIFSIIYSFVYKNNKKKYEVMEKEFNQKYKTTNYKNDLLDR